MDGLLTPVAETFFDSSNMYQHKADSLLQLVIEQCRGEYAALGLLYLGKVNQFYKGNVEAATNYYEQFLKRFPDNENVPLIHYLLAKTKNSTGDRRSARRQLTGIVEKFPLSRMYIYALLQLAGMCYQDGDYKKSVSYYQKVIEDTTEQPMKSVIQRELIYIYSILNDSLKISEIIAVNPELLSEAQFLFSNLGGPQKATAEFIEAKRSFFPDQTKSFRSEEIDASKVREAYKLYSKVTQCRSSPFFDDALYAQALIVTFFRDSLDKKPNLDSLYELIVDCPNSSYRIQALEKLHERYFAQEADTCKIKGINVAKLFLSEYGSDSEMKRDASIRYKLEAVARKTFQYLMDKEEFEQAAEIFKLLFKRCERSTVSNDILFSAGLCQLSINKIDNGIEIFKELKAKKMRQSLDRYIIKAIYELAKCYELKGEDSLAVQELIEFINFARSYIVKAYTHDTRELQETYQLGKSCVERITTEKPGYLSKIEEIGFWEEESYAKNKEAVQSKKAPPYTFPQTKLPMRFDVDGRTDIIQDSKGLFWGLSVTENRIFIASSKNLKEWSEPVSIITCDYEPQVNLLYDLNAGLVCLFTNKTNGLMLTMSKTGKIWSGPIVILQSDKPIFNPQLLRKDEIYYVFFSTNKTLYNISSKDLTLWSSPAKIMRDRDFVKPFSITKLNGPSFLVGTERFCFIWQIISSHIDTMDFFEQAGQNRFACRTSDGKFWMSFLAEKYGQTELFITWSDDGKNWRDPICTFESLGRLFVNKEGNPQLLVLKNAEGERHYELEDLDLYYVIRDNDNDGLSNQLEARLGTDSLNNDSDGDGKTDNVDNNPLFHPDSTIVDFDGNQIRQKYFDLFLKRDHEKGDVIFISSQQQEFEGFDGYIVPKRNEYYGYAREEIEYVKEKERPLIKIEYNASKDTAYISEAKAYFERQGDTWTLIKIRKHY